MAETAFQTQYRQEFIAKFEQTQSLLRDSVTTEVNVKGNTAVFLTAGSGGAEAVTRGVNGRIPARADDNTQTSVTLEEWHDKVIKTDFNVMSSQGNQRALMQRTTMAVMNRKMDSQILTQLEAGTVQTNSGNAVTASPTLVAQAKTKLGNAGVPWDGNIWAVITPAFEGYLEQFKEFASREYVNRLPTTGADLAWRDKPLYYFWKGVFWLVHPNIAGIGTATERCFMYHKSAIGHAAHLAGLEMFVDYNKEDGYSFARCSMHMNAKLLQNSGVVEMVHDGSALS